MYLPDIEIHEAATLAEAAKLMARYAPQARLLAGGTDLVVDLKTGRIDAAHLVSLNKLDALRGISTTDTGLRVGARTTITELDRHPLVRERFRAIGDATREMAAQQIRNVATVGGNIASAVPCADLPPVLMAMNASVELWSPAGTRAVALGSFFVGVRETALRPEEVLTAVLVPHQPAGSGAAYARFQLREGNAIAVAAVAAGVTLEGGTCVREARIVLGAVAPTPMLVESAGAALVGRPPGEEAFGRAADAATEAAEPICDVRASAEYRREMVGVLTRRALAAACQRAKEAKR